ncbi:MAG TPA: xanthine dehydrogenase family protein subunit M [Candidatus Limnocylindrales bacterium]|nr:xanthine dehydrogenase family protein subunit M [Candidatus Limnocylindrales bacterium]
MKPPDFEYARPASVAEAVAQLAAANGDGKVLAGGQSLVPLLNFRLAAPSVLVDLNGIPELAFLEAADGVLRIGAMTRMRALELDPLVRHANPLLAAAARWVGHVQIRNRGTVGGSIAHADPAAEVPAICVLLDAELVVSGPRGERRIPADDFFAGFLTTALGEDEVLTEIRIPAQASGERWGFREFAHRRGDFALAGAAVTLAGPPDGPIERARIAVFGTADRPVRAAAIEQGLVGRPMTEATFADAAAAIAEQLAADDPRPDAAYRRTLTETMVTRALADAASPHGATSQSDGHLEVA